MKTVIILVLLVTAVPLWAQHTTVTAVVQDSNGTKYINGSGSATFVGQNNTSGAGPYLLGGSTFQTVVPFQIDGGGNLGGPGGISLADNNLISPGPSQWRFTFCSSGTTPPICSNVSITITGVTQSITSQLQAGATLLPPAASSNALTLLGATWASPSAIGSTTPNAGTFTTFSTTAGSGTFNGPTSFSGVTNIGIKASQAFSRVGTILTAGGGSSDQGNLQEPSAIYESGGAIFPTGNVFKLWFGCGWTTENVCYAESQDGVNWTRYNSGTPVVTNQFRNSVFKNGSTYYMYVVNSAQTSMNQWTSSDGVNWTQAHTGVLTNGGGGAWDSNVIGNSFVWIEGGSNWKMLYDGNNGGNWSIGLATSSDGVAWTKSGSNPVISNTGAAFVYVQAAGSSYFLWSHTTGGLPTDIQVFTSSNLTTWSHAQVTPALYRLTADEGSMTNNGQVADPFLVEASGQVYFFYSANPNGSSSSGGSHLKLTVAATTMANLVSTDQSSTLNVSRVQTITTSGGGCTTAATIGAHCTSTLIWKVPFINASSYHASCTGFNGVAQGVPVIQQISSQTATSVNVDTVALTAAVAQFSDISCVGVSSPQQ